MLVFFKDIYIYTMTVKEKEAMNLKAGKLGRV